VVLATDHDRFDYKTIKNKARLIIDTRGKYLEAAEHIVKS
jgi:UDP-N-acetyl-D-glucosamine dehydrogenase